MMKRRLQILFVFVLLGAPSVCVAQTSRAEDNKLRLEGFLRLGFAGEVDAEFGSTTRESDLEVGFGFGGGVEYLVHPNFSAGARVQVIFTEVEADDSNHSAIDLNLVPKARFPLPKSPVAMYLSLPLGLAIISSEVGEDDGDTETGFNIGFLFGAEGFITPTFGLFGELGYQWHFFSRQPLIGPEIDITAGNLLLQAGAKLAF